LDVGIRNPTTGTISFDLNPFTIILYPFTFILILFTFILYPLILSVRRSPCSMQETLIP